MEESKKVEKIKPDLVLRVADCKVVVWANDVDIKGVKEIRKSFNLEKIFKVDDVWKSTNSFNISDLDKVIYLLNELKRKTFPVHSDLNN